MMENLSSWLELRAVKGLGPGTMSRLVLSFGSPQAVQAASVEELVMQGGVSVPVAQEIQRQPDSQTRLAIKQEVQAITEGSFSFLTILDDEYPARLKTISDPPPILYLTGNLDKGDHQALAIVGARKATPAARAFTLALSQELASCGFTIVSGLARGVDEAAHRGALACPSGRTVAVLGCGIDRTYPIEHKQLREQIESHGAVLSEFSLGAEPHSYHFPQRNRLISGMSLGIVVTEATERSGSLITARFALEQNREVFAVPGSVTNNMSRGPHQLIKQGAKLVEGIEDILEELLPQLDASFHERLSKRPDVSDEPFHSLGKEEKVLYDRITLEPIALEDLISQDRYPPSEVLSLLLSLEMKGAIRQLAGSQYIRTSVR